MMSCRALAEALVNNNNNYDNNIMRTIMTVHFYSRLPALDDKLSVLYRKLIHNPNGWKASTNLINIMWLCAAQISDCSQ